jgi:hypothetical protein
LSLAVIEHTNSAPILIAGAWLGNSQPGLTAVYSVSPWRPLKRFTLRLSVAR